MAEFSVVFILFVLLVSCALSQPAMSSSSASGHSSLIKGLAITGAATAFAALIYFVYQSGAEEEAEDAKSATPEKKKGKRKELQSTCGVLTNVPIMLLRSHANVVVQR